MSDPALVMGWRLDAAGAGAQSLDLVADQVHAAWQGISRDISPRVTGRLWRGPASTAAARLLEPRIQSLARIGGDLAGAARRLADGFAQLSRLQAALRHSTAHAASRRRELAATAAVGPVGGLLALPVVEALARRADSEVEQVLADSSRADRACATTLAELEASARSLLRLVEPAASRRDALAQLGPAAFSRWLAAMPSADEAPSSVAQWWNAHTAAERDALLADPHLAGRLGALDGLPCSVRDVVNRAALRRRLAGYSLALGQISRALDQLDDADPAVAGLLRRQRRLVRGHRIDLLVERQLTQLARERDAVTGRPLAVQLVLDDPERWDGKGRVAVSIGDADTASHVAYLVPGLGVRPDPDLGDLLADTRRVYDAARADASLAPTAVIAWLGYDTPGWAQVGFDSRALEGGALLAAAVNGLRAARLGDQPHVTVVGHSYGSTTVAAALQRLGAAVDDAVFLGSPGLLAQHAAQLPIERQHVWVGAASGDEVSRLSRFGVDPAAAEFGARRFAAESPPGTSAFAQHLRYFDPGSQSLPNVARIVVGEGHLVRLTPGRTDHGYAGWLAAGLSALLPGAAPASILLARGLYPVTSDPGYG